MLGPAPPADVAKEVAADAASLADAGMLFPADPAGVVAVGVAQITAPREGVAAWTGAPPLSPKAVPQSVPARVSVVLVEETPGRSARKLPSAPNSENW